MPRTKLCSIILLWLALALFILLTGLPSYVEWWRRGSNDLPFGIDLIKWLLNCVIMSLVFSAIIFGCLAFAARLTRRMHPPQP